MDIGIILGLLGLTATLIFGIREIMRKKVKSRVAIIEEKSISLYDDFVAKSNKFTIKYNESNIYSNILMVSFIILNNGDQDISPENIEIPISLVLGKEYYLLESRIKYSSDKLQANLQIENQTIKIITGIFKSDEYIVVELMLKSENTNSPIIPENFQYRIKDIHNIDFVDKYSLSIYRKGQYNNSFLLLTPLILIMVFLFSLFLTETDIKYDYKFRNSKSQLLNRLDSILNINDSLQKEIFNYDYISQELSNTKHLDEKFPLIINGEPFSQKNTVLEFKNEMLKYNQQISNKYDVENISVLRDSIQKLSMDIYNRKFELEILEDKYSIWQEDEEYRDSFINKNSIYEFAIIGKTGYHPVNENVSVSYVFDAWFKLISSLFCIFLIIFLSYYSILIELSNRQNRKMTKSIKRR